MGLTFDGLLGLHILLALAWLAVTFIGLRTLLAISGSTPSTSLLKRALLMQRLIAAAGGLTVLIGLGFYYYINFYRTSYATSSSGLPFIGAGALIGLVAFILQMVQGPRIRRSLTSAMASSSGSNATKSTSPMQVVGAPQWMLLLPAILLLVAFALMIAGSMM